MQTVIEAPFYPISLDEIKAAIMKKNGRRRLSYGNNIEQLNLIDKKPLDNVKKITNGLGEKVVRVDGDIPPDLPINNGDHFLFISYDQSILTHGLHKYPAKFFPELPRWLIKRYLKNKDSHTLDPFSGSGTTNVESLLLGRSSVGIDVDPFSRFLSKVKVTPLNEEELKNTQQYLLRAVLNYKPSKVLKMDIPVFPYMDNWFNREIILELTYLKKTIDSLDASEDIKNFFKICFSSIIRSTSNADDNCTRTVIREKLNKKVYPSDALKKFVKAVLINIPKMIEFSQKCPLNVNAFFPSDMDARNIKYKKHSFDLALTSPPYANAVDYPRTHQLEMYWLGLAKMVH